MGTFSVPLRVGDLAKTAFVEVEALADTGSVHSFMPEDVLNSIDVLPTETRGFAFADDRVVEMPFGYVNFCRGRNGSNCTCDFRRSREQSTTRSHHIRSSSPGHRFGERKIDSCLATDKIWQWQSESASLIWAVTFAFLERQSGINYTGIALTAIIVWGV